MPVKKERVKKWVKALESGKYRKTIGELFSRDSQNHGEFCALGVACDVYAKETGDLKLINFIKENSVTSLPNRVRKWFGFSSESPKVCYNDRRENIESLNDNYNLGFKTIARCIKDTFLAGKPSC